MLWSLVIFVSSLAIVLGAAWYLRRKSKIELPEDVLRPPPPHGFENLSGAEYELIEWELRVDTPPPGEPPGVAPPPE